MQNMFIGEGNLGSSPTLKYVPVGEGQEQKPVVEFDVRFNYQKRNKDSGDFEDNGGFWGRVELWGKRAEHISKHLVKGCRVVVAGEYVQRPYVATKGEREGQQVISNEIKASFVGLSLMGIESVVFEKRNKPEQAEQAAPGTAEPMPDA